MMMNHPLEEIEIEEHSESFVDANSMVNDYDTNNEEQVDNRQTISNRKKSNVWQYFRKTSKGTSTCLLCGATRGHSNGGTSNLWTHLKLAHREKAEQHNISTLTRREVRELRSAAAATGSKVSNLKNHVSKQHKRKWSEHSQIYGADKASDENLDTSPLHATIVWDESATKMKRLKEHTSVEDISYTSTGKKGFCTEEESLRNFCESLFVDMKNVPRENMLKCKMEIYGVIEKYSTMTISSSACSMTECNETL